ncbi:hypothetical protein BIY29_02205 [Brenneria alni]|uniref:Uncharacterized protein n=1 Tax=Brenneria alni TaxID=71656 RepID=A0A421DSQ8_9GAMM|nr:hypothetical protein BIY29_02205 [Brenneria alni]
MIKDTSLAAVITFLEMFLSALRIVSVTYEQLILYVETALIYLMFSTVLSQLQVRLEKYYQRHIVQYNNDCTSLLIFLLMKIYSRKMALSCLKIPAIPLLCDSRRCVAKLGAVIVERKGITGAFFIASESGD